MDKMKLDIQMFADGKVVIDTKLNTKEFENGLDRIKSSSQKAGSTIKNIVIGLGITKLVSSAMNQITNSIDDAILRYDTLNNFPKVMENLGIATEEADESIKKMSDKLAGLPTTLDQGASAVQRFTSKNGNVKKSTDLFLALNNAILAGGASSEIQASALEQLSQAYAKGKPDMMEWRTAMTAMPAQLKQVAIAMGYIDADALGEALRNGSVSMDEFMDTIIELNTKGVKGFASFEKQARNSTGGIKTSITVAKTQVVKGVADIIDALNSNLENTKFGSLGNMISIVGKQSKKSLDKVADLISGKLNAYDFSKEISNLVIRMADSIIKNGPIIFDAVSELLQNFIRGIVDKSPELIKKFFELGEMLLTELEKGMKNDLPVLLESTVTIITEFAKSWYDNSDKIIDIGIEIIRDIMDGISTQLPELINQVPFLYVENMTE